MTQKMSLIKCAAHQCLAQAQKDFLYSMELNTINGVFNKARGWKAKAGRLHQFQPLPLISMSSLHTVQSYPTTPKGILGSLATMPVKWLRNFNFADANEPRVAEAGSGKV